MAKTKSTNSEPIKKSRPTLSTEAREQRMIGYAVDLAEKQLREGTASSQVITHYLKLGTRKAELENDILEKQKELVTAKTEALQSQKRVEELYADALSAMKKYSGQGGGVDDEWDD